MSDDVSRETDSIIEAPAVPEPAPAAADAPALHVAEAGNYARAYGTPSPIVEPAPESE